MSRTTRLERTADEYKDKFPHMKTYAACQSRAFMTGVFTFVAAGATVYVAQELLKNFIPYKRTAFLILPVMVGTVSAYTITRHNTKMCQNMWMAMEEKHSDITPLQERMQSSEHFRDDESPSNSSS
ncbi:transmembrane protein 141-like [Pomacea canaliculata]|uniref:transmembrane protein 141-like n=1 Tax=Pomacea canaliculata TaxID=400727 RepID=UPI000D7275F7|nr:transmembrane protein 141-like [Pomacea canaliculata]